MGCMTNSTRLKALWKPQVIIRTEDLLTFSKLPLNVMFRTQHFITFDLEHGRVTTTLVRLLMCVMSNSYKGRQATCCISTIIYDGRDLGGQEDIPHFL